ncbi:hypothetical protein FBZ93_1228 [Bradyrhizobium macuxiense]|uniref:Uncharacterized protein n=1 Tax=Bradyrhizobium macuxiense TaxID=1755647 RepID=A0A560KVT3_9BRAD|nr:hypothetical protein FBZ93_1228 [Bradyrhizobium macuxiense]
MRSRMISAVAPPISTIVGRTGAATWPWSQLNISGRAFQNEAIGGKAGS